MPPARMVRLATIGQLSVHIGDNPVPGTNGQIIAAMLYLTVERGKPVPRRVLADMFFPDAQADAAAHSGRQLVYRLRKMGADISGDAGSVVLSADAASWDVDDVLARDFLSETELVALHRGYLPDVPPIASLAFAQWLERHREDVSVKLRDLLLRRLKAEGKRGRYTSVYNIARACLALDPFNEEATLAAAESLAMLGAKRDAIALIDRYIEEVGSRSPHLTIAPRILRERISKYIEVRDREPTRLIGRDDELATISAAMEEASKGETRACVVVGPSGIGKTRLLNMACAASALAGHAIVRARLRRHDSKRPFAILRDIASGILDLPGSIGASPEALAGVRGLCGRGPLQYTELPTEAVDTQAIVGRIQADVLDVLDAVAAEQAVVLYVDDGQWIDQASLDLIAAILNDRRAVCVLIATQIAIDLPKGMAASPAVRTVSLGSLDRTEAVTLLHELFADSERKPDAKFVESAARVAGGSPFYLNLLFQNFLETGKANSVPETLSDSLTARLYTLAEPARSVLDAAVILGPESSEVRLERITQIPRFSLIRAMRELEVAGLIYSQGERVLVSHDLFSNFAREKMPSTVSRLLHHSAAVILTEEKASIAEPMALATHWEACGEFQRAFDVFVASADEYSRLGRPLEAIEALKRARSLARTEDQQRKVDLDLVSACRAARHYREGFDIASRLGVLGGGESPSVTLMAIECALGAGNVVEPYIAPLRSYVSDRTLPDDVRAGAAWVLLDIAEDIVSDELAQNTFESIADLREDYPPVLHARMIYQTAFGDPRMAIDLSNKLRLAVETVPTMGARFRYMLGSAVAAWRCGELNTGIAGLEETYDFVKHQKLWSSCIAVASMLTFTTWEYGDPSRADEWFAAATRHVALVPPKEVLYSYWGAGILMALHKGDHVRARKLLEEVEALFPRMKHHLLAINGLTFRIKADLVAGTKPSHGQVEQLLAAQSSIRDTLNDYIADTLIEALTALGRRADAKGFRADYLAHRREKRAIPKLLTFLSGDVAAD